MDRTRIDGIDVARAVAILGMFAAHVGNSGRRDSPGGWDWLWIADGRPSALFAVLVGVSMALIVKRRLAAVAADDSVRRAEAVRHSRVRIAVRAGILIWVGFMLEVPGVPIAVILVNLGLMMLLALPVLTWRSRWLTLSAAVFVVGGRFAVEAITPGDGEPLAPWLPVINRLWADFYPALAWMGYVLVGMAVGRTALRLGHTQAWLAATGVMLTAAGYLVGPMLGGRGLHPEDPPGTVAWASVEHHSYTPFEMTGNIGVALVIIAACVWAAQRARPMLWPLMALGSTAFTAYVTHIIVIAIVGDDMVWAPSNTALIVMTLSITGAMCLIRWRLRRGPMEWIMHRASTAAADASVGREPVRR